MLVASLLLVKRLLLLRARLCPGACPAQGRWLPHPRAGWWVSGCWAWCGRRGCGSRGMLDAMLRGSVSYQLHEKFEHLKRIHQEEKRKVEEKRRELEEEMNAFNRRKVAVETLQSQSLQATSQQPLRKDKDKKK